MKSWFIAVVSYLIVTITCFQSHKSHFFSPSIVHLSAWTGNSCDEKCKENGGFPCGRFFKDCCKSASECVGIAWKECEEGHNIPINCTSEAPTFTNLKKMMGQQVNQNSMANANNLNQTASGDANHTDNKTSQNVQNKTVRNSSNQIEVVTGDKINTATSENNTIKENSHPLSKANDSKQNTQTNESPQPPKQPNLDQNTAKQATVLTNTSNPVDQPTPNNTAQSQSQPGPEPPKSSESKPQEKNESINKQPIVSDLKSQTSNKQEILPPKVGGLQKQPPKSSESKPQENNENINKQPIASDLKSETSNKQEILPPKVGGLQKHQPIIQNASQKAPSPTTSETQGTTKISKTKISKRASNKFFGTSKGLDFSPYKKDDDDD